MAVVVAHMVEILAVVAVAGNLQHQIDCQRPESHQILTLSSSRTHLSGHTATLESWSGVGWVSNIVSQYIQCLCSDVTALFPAADVAAVAAMAVAVATMAVAVATAAVAGTTRAVVGTSRFDPRLLVQPISLLLPTGHCVNQLL